MKNLVFESSVTVFNHSEVDKNELCQFGKAYSFLPTESVYLTDEQAEAEAIVRKFVVMEVLGIEPQEDVPFPSTVVVTDPIIASQIDKRIAQIASFIKDNNLEIREEEMTRMISRPARKGAVYLAENTLSNEAIDWLQDINTMLYGEQLTPHGLLRRSRLSWHSKAHSQTICFSF